MCSRIDGSLVLRSTLVCGATVMYEPISGGWIPVDESFFKQVPESEYYLNALMRRLNNGRQYYIPPTTSELETVKLRYGSMSPCGKCSSSDKSKAEGSSTVDEASSDASTDKERAGTDAKATVTESKEKSATTNDKANTNSRTEVQSKSGNSSSSKANDSNNSKKDFVLPVIPLNIAPFSKLQHVLRYLFETTPFSSSKLNNVFTAVKLLNCLSAGVDKSKSAIYEVPQYLCKLPVPHLERQLEPIAMDGIFLVQGLTPELRRSLQAAATAARRREVIAEARSASAHIRTTEEFTKGKNTKPGSETEKTFDITMQSVRAKSTSGEEDKETEQSESKSSITSSVEEDKEGSKADSSSKNNNSNTETEIEKNNDTNNSSDSAKTTETSSETSGKPSSFTGKVCREEIIETLRTPSHVQLLLAHPMLHGFFWRTVQLLVSNTDNEAAAFVINRPLMSDKGVLATVEAIVRYSRVHPIFARFLSKHTIMVGGPVMVSGSVYESIFLLHRVPGVPKALPISDNLWIDGDLDVLMAKLENREASVEDVVVLCGFAGWGKNQLKGEVACGTWIVAASEANDANVDSFVINIARSAGAFTLRNKRTHHGGKNNVNNTNVDKTNTESSKESSTEMPASKEASQSPNDDDDNNTKVESAVKSSDAETTKETKANTTRSDDDDSQATKKCEESGNTTDTSTTTTPVSSSESTPLIEKHKVAQSEVEGKVKEDNSEQDNKVSVTSDENNKVKETKTDVNTSQENDGGDNKNDKSSDNDDVEDDDDEKECDSDDSDKDVYEEINTTEECEQPKYIFGVKNRWNWVNRHVTYSWAWAFEVLGEPYKGLNKNQLREVREADDDEESG